PKPESMIVRYDGVLGFGVTPKDLILGTIGQMGTAGGQGYVIEYAGAPVEAMSMEGRMTVCNMTIEGGGRAGMVAPDDTTFAWVEGRAGAPADFDTAVTAWRDLHTDAGAQFDKEIVVNATGLSPQVTWGTTPGMVVQVTGSVPAPEDFDSPADREAAERALRYMDLEPRTRIEDIRLDRVF